MVNDNCQDRAGAWTMAADWSVGVPIASSNVVVSQDDPRVTLGGEAALSKTVVLFEGGDGRGDVELWETNGTAAGTVEITSGFEAGTEGLNPSFITAYGGEALFDGVNASGSYGLWATNGTASGTHQIEAIKGANPGGLFPMYMDAFNGEVLFRGLAGVLGDDVPGLWVTKGTAASTVEIGGAANAGIHNVFSGGLLPSDPDFTDFNSVVYFEGQDAEGNIGLWRTDGTASSTFELDPIKGAAGVGSTGSDIQPQYMTVLGTEMLFEGADKRDTPGSLWETDGTAAGTVEIGGQGNAGIKGSPTASPAHSPRNCLWASNPPTSRLSTARRCLRASTTP